MKNVAHSERLNQLTVKIESGKRLSPKQKLDYIESALLAGLVKHKKYALVFLDDFRLHRP